MNKHLNAVGQIMYAVGICDGNLHLEEKGQIIKALAEYRNEIISNTHIGQDELSSAECIVQEISTNGLDAWSYFDNFKNYFNSHSSEFSSELKDLILNSAKKIAFSYARQNKSEIVLLARTRLLLTSD